MAASGVTIESTADYYGEIPIDDGSGMSAMDDHNWDVSTFLEETFGDNYADYVVESITGFVIYSYSTFEIAPRNASDFVFAPSASPTVTPPPTISLAPTAPPTVSQVPSTVPVPAPVSDSSWPLHSVAGGVKAAPVLTYMPQRPAPVVVSVMGVPGV